MNELTVSISLWLPVGRANFYSTTANGWLLVPPNPLGEVAARSRMLDRHGYVPRLQVSVLRRLLEVLPVSFGYERSATCVMNRQVDDLSRPIAVTLTLHPKPAAELATEGPERWANLALAEAGVHEVTLHVDEHGGYTFTARAVPSADGDVAGALAAHVREIFGGDYSLDRRSGQARSSTASPEGSTAVRRYNGVHAADPARGHPRGILTFFQLNILAEGLFNESLAPAVFFEQNEFLRKYIDDGRHNARGSLTLFDEMGQVIDLLAVRDIDAGQPEGLVIALRKFIDVTSREVLQRLKWSVESVRRSLLDESVGMLHRQSKLFQLDLGALERERSPELAVGASESQLRGYVMLAAAKLPLVQNVYEFATLAKDHLEAVAHGKASSSLTARTPASGGAGSAVDPGEVRRLAIQLENWESLLRGLQNNVRGLENAIEHAWRENLLYEQRAMRSEQEAMAEIQRSRATGPTSERPNMNAYNVLMLLFTVAAVLVAIREGNLFHEEAGPSDWRGWVTALWPVIAVTVVFALIVPAYNRLLQKSRERRGHTDRYPYEFTFRLEEAADPRRVYAYLSDPKPKRIRTSPLRELTLTSHGGGRIERVSQHRALVKINSIATFRIGRRHYARFEVVKEILAHRVSGRPSFMIIQCRLFGDAPRPLKPDELLALARAVLEDVGSNLTGADRQRSDAEGIDVGSVLDLIEPLLARSSSGTPAPVVESDDFDGDQAPDAEEPTTARLPRPRA
jgi:hypothetical protein